jgi:CRP-like cAMP-binding protein
MLSIEQEPIRLPPIETEVEVSEGRKIRFRREHDASTVRLIVPRRFLFLWDQSKIGASLYDLSLRSRAAGSNQRVFLEVASFLCFLVDNDLIDDVRLVRMADSIRGEYEWPDDLTKLASSSSVLSVWPRRGSHTKGAEFSSLSRVYDSLFALLALLSLPVSAFIAVVLIDVTKKTLFFEPLVSAFRWNQAVFGLAAGVFVTGVFGRSLVASLRMIGSKLGKDAGELSVAWDLMGPHLSFNALTVTGALRRVSDFLICFSAMIVPVLLWIILRKADALSIFKNLSHGQLLSSSTPLVLFFSASAGVAALMTHPSTRSELTKSLRVWNRTPLAWREDEELLEVETFHRLGGFLSAAMALLCVSTLITAAWLSWGPGDRKMTSAVCVAGLILFALTYLEPVFGHALPGASTRNRRRRLWATKVKVLAVAAADREAWAQLPVLRQLTPPIRNQLISLARVVEFKPGKSICRQGSNDRSLYIVLEGKLGVAKSFDGRRRKVVAILTAGSVFGETAFFFGMPRSADVVAMEDCKLLEIPYVTSMQNLDISSSEEFQFRVWLLQALSGNPMLKDLPSEAMDTLIFAGKRKLFKAGQPVFTEGAPADSCYFIAQGRASAVQQGKKISEMGAGDAFGEIALLKIGSRRTASVVADSDLLCMELDIESFWGLLAARLPLGAEIERLALRRLKADEDRRSSHL